MRSFWNKYGKSITLGILSVLLIVAIFKMINLQNQLKESVTTVQKLDKKIEDYNKNITMYEHIVDSLNKQATQKNVIVVTKTDLYEKTKNTPINTTLTDRELIDRLKKFRARYREENKIGSSN